MKTVTVTIKGISPMLMHSFPMVPIEGIEKKTPQEQAELCLYRLDGQGTIYVPGNALQRCLVGAASYSKGKGRGSLVRVAAAALFVRPDALIVKPQTWVIDSCPVVVPVTRGRVVRHRPRFDEWSLEFEVDYDETLMKEWEVRKIVDDAGQRVGLLDFRPEKKGPFG